MTKTAASLVRELAIELQRLDRRRIQVLMAMRALTQLIGTSPRLAVPVEPTRRRPAEGRSHRSKLYRRTLGLIRASPEPLTTKEIRLQLRARKLATTNVYYHLGRAVQRGDVLLANGRYSAPRHTSAQAHKEQTA